MKRLVLAVMAALMMLALAAPVMAAGPNYVTLRGGLGWADDVDRTVGPWKNELSYKDYWELDVAYGRYFCDYFRLEGEIGYAKLKVDDLTGTNSALSASGEDEHWKFMVNAIVDWKNSTPFTPYIGAGIGAAYVYQDLDITTPSGRKVSADDRTWDFAYQFLAGASWAINADWTLDLMYRYYSINDRTHDLEGGNYETSDIDPHHIQTVLLGLRYNF